MSRRLNNDCDRLLSYFFLQFVFLSPDAKTPPSQDKVLSWLDLQEIGKSCSDDLVDEVEKNAAANSACLVIYTSGTTGAPKGKQASWQ